MYIYYIYYILYIYIMWDCILFSILGISRRLIRCVWKWCSDWLTWSISSCKRNITIIWLPRTVPSESPSLWILPAISGFSGEYVFWFYLINSKYLKMLGPFSLMNFFELSGCHPGNVWRSEWNRFHMIPPHFCKEWIAIQHWKVPRFCGTPRNESEDWETWESINLILVP